MKLSKYLCKLMLCGAMALAAMTVCAQPADKPHTFEVGKQTFLLDGKPFVIKAAEVHYARIPAEYWEHRIQMCKALGMNTICLYVFWNIHEQKPGQFDFEGQNDIVRFCRLAQKHGMYVLLRPGPYACAEWEMGALPWWLLKKKDIRLRTNDPYFLERCALYLKQIGKQLADWQITRGGNIIMVQVENEYGAFATDKSYVAHIRDMVREAGFTDIPLFQCDWSSNFANNALDDLLWTINFGTGANIEAQFKPLREARPDTPLMCSEFWSGWFDHWGRRHETRDAGVMVDGIRDMLDRNISFSLYMTHGGTTFGHWGGGNCPPYSAMCSSYDYDAPISEAGWATPKYYKLRELIGRYLEPGQTLSEVPDAYPVIEIPEFSVDRVAPLFENLPRPNFSEDIQPMEQFDQGWGSILYRTTLPEVKAGTILFIDEMHDWAQVYADGRLLGRLDRRKGETKLKLPALKEGTQLDILIEAMGRVNFDEAIHDRKGITQKVELIDAQEHRLLKNWQVYSFPTDYSFVKDKKYRKIGGTSDVPAFYKGTFTLSEVGDVFLDMSTWGKGMVWVNGKAMGRFWKIGPQQTLYMPGCWLKKGKNEIIILDLLGPEKTVVKGLKQPILDKLRPEADNTTLVRVKPNLQAGRKVAEGELKPENVWQEVKFSQPCKGRYFCLEMTGHYGEAEEVAIAELNLLDADGQNMSRQKWQVAYVSSESIEEGNHSGEKVFDLQESTYWKSKTSDAFPQRLIIDMQEEVTITGFRYLPRAEKDAPGMVKGYRAYVGSDLVVSE